MGTDNISLNWPNLSFISVLHTLMDRYFFPGCQGSPGWTQDKIPEEDANYNVLQRSIGHRSQLPSWAEGNTVRQPADLLLQHLRNHQLQTAPLKSRGMRANPTDTFSLSKKAVKMRQPRQIGHNQGFYCIVTKSVYVENLYIFLLNPFFNTHFDLKQIPRKINIKGKIQEH